MAAQLQELREYNDRLPELRVQLHIEELQLRRQGLLQD